MCFTLCDVANIEKTENPEKEIMDKKWIQRRQDMEACSTLMKELQIQDAQQYFKLYEQQHYTFN